MNVEVQPDDDLIQSAYAKWAALPKDVRGAITMELAQAMATQRDVVRRFANMRSGTSDLGAQIERREMMAEAYESAFYILAHAGMVPTKIVRPVADPIDASEPAPVDRAEEWGWYIEDGGGVFDGFASRAEAIEHAVREDRADFLVGPRRTIDVALYVDAHSIIEWIEERIADERGLEDFKLRHGPEGRAALKAWAREHLEADPSTFYEGTDVTPDEIATARAAILARREGRAA